MAKKVGLTEYAKNLIKSTKYAAIDVVKETMPNTTEFMETNNDLFKDISATIRNRRVIFNKVSTQFKQSKIYDTIDEAKHNIIEDIKSGKLYNKDPIRERRINKKAGMDDLLGGFDDFDFDFDSDDTFDFEIEDNANLAFAIDDSNRASADMIATTIAGTSSHQINANKLMNQMSIIQMQEGFSTVNSNLGNLTNTIANLGNDLNSLYQTNAENAKTYYEKSTELQANMVSYLKELVDLQKKSAGVRDEKPRERKYNSFNDVTSDGIPDIAAYGKLLKSRLDDNLSMITGINSMMGENTNMSMTFAMSPLAFLPKMVVKNILGNAIQTSAKKLDDSISNIFGTFISTMNEISNNAGFMDLKGSIARFFGLNDSIKTERSINTSYNKENKPWNGKAEKALTEVIPTLLSKILAVQSGTDEITYNYDSGKFITVKKLKEEFNNRINSEINNSFYDIRSGMDNLMRSMGMEFENEENKKAFTKDYNRFFEYFFKSNNRFNPNKKSYDDYYDLGISQEHYELITALFDKLDPSIKMSMDRKKLRGRQNINEFIDKIPEYNQVMTILNNGSDLIDTNKFNSNGFLNSSKDDNGHNIFWYLRNILQAIKGQNIGNIDNMGDIDNEPSVIQNNITPQSIYRRNVEFSADNMLYNRPDSVSISGIIDARLGVVNEANKLDEEENKSIIDDLLESDSIPKKAKSIIKRMQSVKNGSRNKISGLIDTVNLKIYQAMYGNKKYKGKDVNGIIGVMMENIDETFTKFNTFLDEKILNPLKTKLDENGGFKGLIKNIFGIDVDEIREKLFGKDSLFGKVVQSVKDDFKGAWDYSKGAFVNTYKDLYEKIGGNQYDSKFNKIMNVIKYGKKNTEGGFIVDSEGQLNMLNQVKKVNNTTSNVAMNNTEVMDSVIDGQLSLFKPDEQSAIQTASEELNTPIHNITNALLNGGIDSHDKGGVIRTTKIALVHEGEEVITKEEKAKRDKEKFYKKRGTDYIDKLKSALDGTYDGELNSSEQKTLDFLKNIDDTNFQSVKDSLGSDFKADTAETLQNEIIEAIGHKKGQPTLIEQMKDTATSGINRAMSVLFGDGNGDGNETADDLAEKGKSAIKDIMGHFKEYLPSGVSGALIGSLAGGIIGMPMLGAAIGSSFNIIKRSDKLQEYLFGDLDEDGNRIGNGKLPTKLVDAMNKYAPDMKKYGITGAITSILPFVPGGPVAGLLLGAGVGFAKNNTQIQDFLFGDMGIIKGLKGKGENLKKALPKMGLGAAALAFTGPFGLLGNALLGAGAGFVTQTNKFQEFMFGKDGKDEDGNPIKIGGFLPMIRDRVVQPIKEFGSSLKDKFQNFVDEQIRKPFHKALSPFIEEFKNQGKALFGGIKDAITGTIDNIFTNVVGKPLSELIEEKIVDPISGFFKKFFGTIGKLVGGIIKFPTKIMKGMADSLRLKHIKEGKADYMTDEELAELKADRPFDFLMATSGDRMINMIKKYGIGSLFRSKYDTEEHIEPEEEHKLSFREKVSMMTNGFIDKYKSGVNKLATKVSSGYHEGMEEARNAKQKIKSKAYMLTESALNKIADRAQAGARYANTMREPEAESEGESSGSTTSENVRRIVKIPSVKNANIVKSPEVDMLKQEIRQLNDELAVLQARKEEGDDNTLGKQTKDYIKDIRNEVYGQLDGIGYNVHTIANILVERFGMPELKAKGAKVSRGNLRRKAWFERVFGFILNPARKIKQGIKSLFWGKDGNGGLLGTPMRFIKSGFEKIGKIGEVIGHGLGKMFDLGVGIIKGFGVIGGIFKESIAALAPAFGHLLKGAVKVLTLPIDILSGAMEGLGNMLGGLAKGIGILGGKMFEMVGLIPSLVTNIGKLTIEVGKLGFKLAKAVGSVLIKPFSLLFNSIFGKGKNKNNKKTIEHIIKGGFLDEIKQPINLNGAEERHNELLSFFSDKFNTLFNILRGDDNIDRLKLGGKSDEDDDKADSILPIPDLPKSDSLKISDDELTNMSYPEFVRKGGRSLKDLSHYADLRSKVTGFEPPVQESASLPTEFGVIRYDQDSSGELRPIKDSVFTQYQEKLNAQTEHNESMFNLINTGDADDTNNKVNGKKVSWISKIANSIGSVLMGGTLLKVVGAGLMAGALYDLGKNGENSFMGKTVKLFTDKIIPLAGDLLINKIIPTLIEGLCNALPIVIESSVAMIKNLFKDDSAPEVTMENGNTIDQYGNMRTPEGDIVALASVRGGGLTEKVINTLDTFNTSVYNGLNDTDNMTYNKYITSQIKKINDYVSQTNMTPEQYQEFFANTISNLQANKAASVNPLLFGSKPNKKEDEYAQSNTDLVELFRNSEAGKKFEAENDINYIPTQTEIDDIVGGKGKKSKRFGLGGTFYSQNDPRWGNLQFNTKYDTEKQTIADSGCGPVAAAMVANDYNLANPIEASQYALNNGYKEQNGGTDPRFFKDYFNKKGINSTVDQNIQNNQQKKQSIINNLRQNKPVVLMGKSKGGNTPYGNEYPHYVVATGMRGNNIVVNDPYSTKGGELYNAKDTLNSSTVSIKTGKGKLYGRVGTSAAASLQSDGNLTSGTTAFDFVKDITTTFTSSIGELFGIDLFNKSSASSTLSSSNLVSGTVDIGNNQYDAEIVAQVINNFFKNSSKLRNIGPAMVSIASTARHDKSNVTGIDPLIFAAVVMQETGGDSKALNEKNNPGGMMDPKTDWSTLIKYDTIEEGLTGVAVTINRIWNVDGKPSIEGLGSVYCPVGAANDPKGLNKHWVPNVTKYYNQLLQDVIKAGGLTSSSSSVSGSNSLGIKIAQTAISYIGKGGYKMGGTDLERCVDCSGFSQGIYKKCGISIPRTASAQEQSKDIVTVGTSVTYQAQAGDIIFFQGTYKAGVSHVGICTGNGDEFIESGGADGTKIRSAHYSTNSYNKKHFHSICRHKKCMSTDTNKNTNPIKNSTAAISSPTTVFNNGMLNVPSTGKGKDIIKSKYNRIRYVKDNNKDAINSIKYGKGINEVKLNKSYNSMPNSHKLINNSIDINNSKVIYGKAKSPISVAANLIKETVTNTNPIIKTATQVYDNIKSRINSNNESNSDVLLNKITQQQNEHSSVINKLVESQNTINTKIQNIGNSSDILKDIYNLILLIVNSGIDIKNLDKILKMTNTSASNSILSMINNSDFQSPSSELANKELITKFKELAK